jgi:hypothetical protein
VRGHWALRTDSLKWNRKARRAPPVVFNADLGFEIWLFDPRKLSKNTHFRESQLRVKSATIPELKKSIKDAPDEKEFRSF